MKSHQKTSFSAYLELFDVFIAIEQIKNGIFYFSCWWYFFTKIFLDKCTYSSVLAAMI